MLTEYLVASTLVQGQNATTSAPKVGILYCQFKPKFASLCTVKRSSTQSNCLAVGSSHVYAAQADKATLQVYNKAKFSLEPLVPFPERIHSIALTNAFEGTAVLVIGTEGGRLILWEVSTGRSISTSASHLQPVSSLTCDPEANFILSGSADSNVHVWSLPDSLSFYNPSSEEIGASTALTPLRTFSNHHAPITGIALGHSRFKNNTAVSIARDNTALIWEYKTGILLRTILLPAIPLCATLDPADRALFVGYEDGTVQSIDFFPAPSIRNSIHDKSLRNLPLQVKKSEQWVSPITNVGTTNCLSLSYDGTSLLSGHASGRILSWDVPKKKYAYEIQDLSSPITNIAILPTEGFRVPHQKSNTGIQNVVRARYDHMLSSGAAQSGPSVPPTYTFSVQFTTELSAPRFNACDPLSSVKLGRESNLFSTALEHPSFPGSLLSEGLLELSTWNTKTQKSSSSTEAPDMIMLDTAASPQPSSDPDQRQDQTTALRSKIRELEAERSRAWDYISELNKQNVALMRRERLSQKRKDKRKERRLVREEAERAEWLRANGVETVDSGGEEGDGNPTSGGMHAGDGRGKEKKEDDEDLGESSDSASTDGIADSD